MHGMRVSTWATGSSKLLRGRSAAAGMPRLASGELRFADGSTAEVGADLIELLEMLLGAGLDGYRARVEVTPELVTPDEAAELLGVSRPTVYAWQDSGVLGNLARGNRRMVPIVDIDAVRDAAASRAIADRLATAAGVAGPVLGDAEYREALHQARKSGGEAAAAAVRRAQRAAQVRAAATTASSTGNSAAAGE